MLTYEDYLKVQGDEKKTMEFILRVIGEHKRSKQVAEARTAQAYYDGENTTILQYEKVLYDMAGKAHVDLWSANHKIASSFFTDVIDQEVSYLLGNGVRFSKDDTKKRLGQDFDENVMDALEYARIGGAAYGFWNLDHIDVFRFTEFAPVFGEENNAIMLGVRYWQIDIGKPLRMTFFEADGFTEYIWRSGEEMKILRPKRPYVLNVRSAADGTEIVQGENYSGFPVVPLYSNKQHTSALHGRRNTIDALDLARSNMINNVDEGNLIYWVLTNCGGMDDLDDARFIEQLKTTHVTHADGDSGAKAEAHTLEAPFQGTKVTIDDLEDALFQDFQAFDAKSLTANDMSATAITAGYTRLDMKTDKIERQVTRFINGILALAGIDDAPTYTRNRVINRMEETQTLVMQAEYFDEEYITKKLLSINGDIDQFEEIMKRREETDYKRFDDAQRRLKDKQNGADDV